jgi:hypothetical protein
MVTHGILGLVVGLGLVVLLVVATPTPPDPAAAEERQKEQAKEDDAQGSVDVLRVHQGNPQVWRVEDRETGVVCYMASTVGGTSVGISCLPLSVPK